MPQDQEAVSKVQQSVKAQEKADLAKRMKRKPYRGLDERLHGAREFEYPSYVSYLQPDDPTGLEYTYEGLPDMLGHRVRIKSTPRTRQRDREIIQKHAPKSKRAGDIQLPKE